MSDKKNIKILKVRYIGTFSHLGYKRGAFYTISREIKKPHVLSFSKLEKVITYRIEPDSAQHTKWVFKGIEEFKKHFEVKYEVIR